MVTTIEDCKRLGDGLMKAAKENLTNSGHVLPVLCVVQDGEIKRIIGLPGIPTDAAKYAAYQKLADILSIMRPDAVILINDAYMKHMDADKFKGYKSGDLSEDVEAEETIVITFKGPTIPSHLSTQPYERDKHGDIVFKDGHPWRDSCMINLLPDWWGV